MSELQPKPNRFRSADEKMQIQESHKKVTYWLKYHCAVVHPLDDFSQLSLTEQKILKVEPTTQENWTKANNLITTKIIKNKEKDSHLQKISTQNKTYLVNNRVS